MCALRMAGVEVIDRRPFDLAPEVLLDAGHQPAHVGGQVKLAGVFRRHDEAKLVRFAQARFFEGSTPHRSVGPIEHALGTVRFDAVALDVPKVQRGRLRARRHKPHDTRLNYNATRIGTMRLGAQGRSRRAPPPASAKREKGEHLVAKRPGSAFGTPSLPLAESGPK
jgi:hypothetical protein